MSPKINIFSTVGGLVGLRRPAWQLRTILVGLLIEGDWRQPY